MSKQNSYRKKFRWYDGKRNLTAGGLLPYDSDGVWVIREISGEKSEYTDIGGKYRFEDGNIYNTIAREFGEELYYSSEILGRDVKEIEKTIKFTYINGYHKRPVYACLIVPVDVLKKYGVKLDPKLFEKNRLEILKQNKFVPVEYYKSVELCHVTFKEIGSICIHRRLNQILKNSELFDNSKETSILFSKINISNLEEK